MRIENKYDCYCDLPSGTTFIWVVDKKDPRFGKVYIKVVQKPIESLVFRDDNKELISINYMIDLEDWNLVFIPSDLESKPVIEIKAKLIIEDD